MVCFLGSFLWEIAIQKKNGQKTFIVNSQKKKFKCPVNNWKGQQDWGTGRVGLRCILHCCCEVASVVADSMWPHRRQPISPWDSPGKNTSPTHESEKWKWSRSVVSDPQWPHGLQAPPPMGFSRREYWSGVPSPSPTFYVIKYVFATCSPASFLLVRQSFP